ncbi:MAG: DUF29 domain-containing protein [Hydrogenothermaceae bacterium]|nr:DUF29 domain-containing protein [Hydrogenothermaceae bacterium]
MFVKDISKEELKQLYDKDFPLWAEINLQLLKEKAYELVDWENLLEEIEDMAKSDLKACISYLAIILEHLYKIDNFKHLAGGELAGNKWRKSVLTSRNNILSILEHYPSLKNKLPEELNTAWIYAKGYLKNWLIENDYNPEDFNIPAQCPYTYQEAMERKL